MGAGTRGGSTNTGVAANDTENPFADKASLKLELLTPAHTGLTLSNKPTIYWYISSASPGPILLQISNQRQVFPIFEHYLPAVRKSGIYSISFETLNFVLNRDLDYKVGLTPLGENGRPFGTSSGKGAVRFVEADAELKEKMKRASREELAALLGQHGIWYDMIDQLSLQIESNGSESAQKQRTYLLRQAGINHAAQF